MENKKDKRRLRWTKAYEPFILTVCWLRCLPDKSIFILVNTDFDRRTFTTVAFSVRIKTVPAAAIIRRIHPAGRTAPPGYSIAVSDRKGSIRCFCRRSRSGRGYPRRPDRARRRVHIPAKTVCCGNPVPHCSKGLSACQEKSFFCQKERCSGMGACPGQSNRSGLARMAR